MQLVAGDSIDIQSSGGVSAGGGGGCGHEGQGGGGGSDGSILIEAPVVTITGSLSANGGSGAIGSGGTDGSSGQPGSDPAAGAGESGGAGSGGADEAGSAGTVVGTSDFGGGCGGAGRIRINTTAGETDVAPGLLSPSSATDCVTQGTLAD